MRHIYILKCADNTLYTGITTELERRVEEHNTSPKGAKYTKARRPVVLSRSTSVEGRGTATKIERMIKKYTKQKKELLIAGEITLPEVV